MKRFILIFGFGLTILNGFAQENNLKSASIFYSSQLFQEIIFESKRGKSKSSSRRSSRWSRGYSSNYREDCEANHLTEKERLECLKRRDSHWAKEVLIFLVLCFLVLIFKIFKIDKE